MKYRRGRVEDVNLAWEMAIVEAPFREKIISERALGKTATYLAQLNTQAKKAARLAGEKYKQRIRAEAYNEIVRASDTPVIEKGLFEKFWGSGASKVWYHLQSKVAETPQIPLEFVPVLDDGEFILRGDLRMAAFVLKSNPSGIILGSIVEYLGTEEGKWLLECQGLSPDMFNQAQQKNKME